MVWLVIYFGIVSLTGWGAAFWVLREWKRTIKLAQATNELAKAVNLNAMALLKLLREEEEYLEEE